MTEVRILKKLRNCLLVDHMWTKLYILNAVKDLTSSFV